MGLVKTMRTVQGSGNQADLATDIGIAQARLSRTGGETLFQGRQGC